MPQKTTQISSIQIYFEKSVSQILRETLSACDEYFQVTCDCSTAQVIIFENDDRRYILKSSEYLTWPQKCIVISETDLPTYFLPACYCANKKCLLSSKRAKTISYFLYRRAHQHPYIKPTKLKDKPVFLYSFVGGSTSWLRKRLFKLVKSSNDAYISATNEYENWNFSDSYLVVKRSIQKAYAETLENSIFILCPRGTASSSNRVFEVMEAGRIPVILSDSWVPIDSLPWSEFSIAIREKELCFVDRIIRQNQLHAQELANNARRVWEKYLAPPNDLKLLYEQIKLIQQERNESRELLIRNFFPLIDTYRYAKSIILGLIKFIILTGFYYTGVKFPYSLNRPIGLQLKKLRSSEKNDRQNISL